VTRVWFRNADNRYPFLWESDDQPAARWHAAGEGPTQYLADTPDGAWAEFLRHEEITDPADLRGIERALWAVEVDEDAERIAAVKDASRSHPVCQAEARALRDGGATALDAPSAALAAGAARGQLVSSGLVEAPDREGRVLVLFGPRPEIRGWRCVAAGTVSERILRLVRRL